MTLSKLPNKPKPNKVYETIDNIIDVVNTGSGGGTATDVQVNGTSITNNNVANLLTNSAYNASSNKIATMNDLLSKANNNSVVHLTGDENITGNKTISNSAIFFAPALHSSSYGQISSDYNYGFKVGAVNNNNLSLGGKDLTYYSTENDTNYTLLTGFTGLIPDARLSSNIARTTQIPTDVANTTLSNLGSTSCTNFDGQYVYKRDDSLYNTQLTSKGLYQIDMSSYLSGLDDDYIYLVDFVLWGRRSGSNAVAINLYNDIFGTAATSLNDNSPSWINITGGQNAYNHITISIPFGTQRTLYCQVLVNALSNGGVYPYGYRRVGTNT